MTGRTIKQVLQGARKLLTTEGWVKGDDHRIEDGESKFCARGAVQIAAGGKIVNTLEVDPYVGPKQYTRVTLDELDNQAYQQSLKLLDRVATKHAREKGVVSQAAECSVVGYNDFPASTLEDVLAIFDDAMALADAQETVNEYPDGVYNTSSLW